MRENRRNVLVGIFVLVAFVALGILIVLFGQAPTWMLRGRTYPLVIHFESVSGVRSGTPVTMFGKSIGTVGAVEFRDMSDFSKGVQVTVEIDDEFKLPRDSRAETYAAGLLAGGRPPIVIIPGPPGQGAVPAGGTLPGVTRGALETIFPMTVVDTFDSTAIRIGLAAEKLTPVLEDLHELMRARTPAEVDQVGGPPGNLASAISRLDSSLHHFNVVLGDPETQSHFKEAVANFYAMSEDGKATMSDVRAITADAREVPGVVKEFIQTANDSVLRLDDRTERVARRLIETLDDTSSVLTQAKDVLAKVNAGQGTLGHLVGDNRLYESLVLTFQRLAETTEEARILIKDWQKGKVRVAF